MKISIVVPAFNEAKLITASLREIQTASSAFRDLGWETELIVCDNNSTDETPHLARAEGAIVVFEPINQIGRARNRGAEAATGDWLVFIDADSHPSRALLSDVARVIQSGRCLAGGSTVLMDADAWYPVGRLLVHAWNLISRVAKLAAGSFIFCETQAFREIGGFNLELFASEEIDLSRRLKRLARRRGKRFIILHRHPLLTSARKMHLYSRGEYIRFLLNVLLHPRKALRQRKSCPPWYDGRR